MSAARVSLALFVLGMSMMTVRATAQSAAWSYRDAYPGFPFDLDGTGDMDGDGVPDLVASAFGSTLGFVTPGVVLALSGRDGRVLHALDGATGPAVSGPGPQVTGTGDMDGDGHGDFAYASGTGPTIAVSGATGALIGTFPGAAPLGLGDVDGDGLGDVATILFGVLDDTVTVWSGADGAVVHQHVLPPGSQPRLGRAGDADGDGIQDLAVTHRSAPGLVRLTCVSGPDGAELWSDLIFNPISPFTTAGTAGDVDGDGGDDLAVLVWAPVGGAITPVARLRSGADGALLREVFDPLMLFPSSVAAVGDRNRDGVPDFAVGGGGLSPAAGGRVTFFSGADGSVLSVIPKPLGASGLFFGRLMAALGDVTGGGVVDIAVGQGATGMTSSGQTVHLFTEDRPITSVARAHIHGPGRGRVLSAAGELLPDAPVAVALRNGPAHGFVALAVGAAGALAPAGDPFFFLVPEPDVVLPVMLDAAGAAGAADLEGRWPAGLPAGAQLWVQEFEPLAFPTAPSSWTYSNTLVFTAP